MKRFSMFVAALLIIMGSIACFAQTNNKNGAAVSPVIVEVYYFHFTQRCATCLAVEDNAKKAVESLYPGQVKKGEVVFKGLNLDDATTKPVADKLGIGGQTLLVVCGSKKIDITSQAFLNAHDVNKMQEEIRKAVQQALKG
jgi:hypothetical protein